MLNEETGDAALRTLLLPFATGQLKWPEARGVLFLRARTGPALREAPRPGLICEQSYKPAAEALQRDGWPLRTAHNSDDTQYPLVMVLPPRQRQEARALLARAAACCEPGGTIVACMANDEGARSGESDLKALMGGLSGSVSKSHCRVYWSAADAATCDATLLVNWLDADAPCRIADGRFLSRPGVFAWDRIDPASALLAEHLPATLAGNAADLGCGFGYLAVELLQRCRGITSLDLYEAESRALDLARENLSLIARRLPLEFHWHDVTRGLPRRYNVIISNPPFHAQGAGDRPDIGRAFIAAAAAALLPGGQLWMVANRHLPYESVLGNQFGVMRVVKQARGFKIIEAVKAGMARA